jgi:hypothetical protein
MLVWRNGQIVDTDQLEQYVSIDCHVPKSADEEHNLYEYGKKLQDKYINDLSDIELFLTEEELDELFTDDDPNDD